jgi:hypothetical protein
MAAQISLTLPLSQAFYRMKRLLIDSFDPVNWLVIGFCAWLAQLGGSTAGVHYNFRPRGANLPNLQHILEQARRLFTQHLMWMLPLALFAGLVVLAIGVLILWVSSRGQFMFVHCVALERAEAQVPWNEYRREAHSLFLFRLIISLLLLLVAAPFAGSFLFLLWPMLPQHAAAATALKVLFLVVLALLSMLFAFGGLIIGKLTRDFVVPIQFVRRCGCLEAWRTLLGLIGAFPAEFLLYLLFQLVLWIAVGAAVFTLGLMTCCVGWCLLALPYLGTVLLLPIDSFRRGFSMHYLAQFGQGYSPVNP